MDVSIILVSYNTKDLTRDCINSIYEKTVGLNYDIYVVDNNSQDGSQEMIAQEFPNIHLIKNQDNNGFGAANNVAIKHSNAKYIFCLNTDTLLVNNAIKILFDYMEANVNVGACGGQIYKKDMTLNYSVGNYPTISRIFFQFLGLNRILKKYWINKLTPAKIVDYKVPTEVDYIIGADLMLRKSVLDKIGLYDEKFFLYGEESDLCYRIKNDGNKVIFLPDAQIIHLQGQSSKNTNTTLILYSSLIYWYKKNISYTSSIILQICMCINFIICYMFTHKNHYKDLFFSMLKKS